MARFGLKEVADVTFIDLTTNKPVLYLDSLKMSNLENAADTAHATGGKGNPRLLTWDFNRTAQFKMQDALIDPRAFALLAGTTLFTGATTVHEQEVLTVIDDTVGTNNKVVLSHAPLTGTVTLFKMDGNTMGAEITPVTVSTNDVVFLDAKAAIGSQVMAFYQYTSGVDAQVITVNSDKFPGYYKIVGDTLMRNEATGADDPYQIVVAKAKLMPGFTLSMQAQGDPTVFDFNLEVYKPANGTEMVRMVKYSEA